MPVIRKNITALSDTEVRRLIDGFRSLRTKDQYFTFLTTHFRAINEVHRTPLFLPWHRMFLLQFESLMQDALNDSNFGVPYWDWTADFGNFPFNRGPVWGPLIMGGAGSPVTDGPFTPEYWATESPVPGQPPVYGGKLTRVMSDEMLYAGTLPRVHAAMGKSDFAAFEQAVQSIHNAMHLWIGGQMEFQEHSVNDPVFWLHHSNVERIFCEYRITRNLTVPPNFPYVNPNYDPAHNETFSPAAAMPPVYGTEGSTVVGLGWRTDVRYDQYYFMAPYWPVNPTPILSGKSGREAALLPRKDGLTLAFVDDNGAVNVAVYDGTDWGTCYQILGAWITPFGIALTAFGGLYHLILMHGDGSVYLADSPDGGTNWTVHSTPLFDKWGPQQTVQVCHGPDQALMVLVSTDNRVFISRTPSANAWSTPVQILGDFGTAHAVGIAYFQGQYHLVLSNYEGKVFHAISPDGINWPVWSPPSPKNPAPVPIFGDWITPLTVNLVATDSQLLATVVHGDGTTNIATYDGEKWSGPKQIFTTDGWETDHPFTIANFRGQLHMIVFSTHGELNHAITGQA